MQDQRIGTIVWRGKWIILVLLALGIGLAVLATKTEAKVYEASVTVQVAAVNPARANVSNVSNAQQVSEGLATTYATLITDRSFLSGIRSSVAHGKYSLGDLQSDVNADAIQNTALVRITTQGSSPAEARALASDVAKAFLTTLQQNTSKSIGDVQTEIQAQLRTLERQIARVRAGGVRGSFLAQERLQSLNAARSALLAQYQTVVANNLAQAGNVTLAGPATALANPIRPRPTFNLLAGALLGLLLGLALAWLRVRLDRGLHSASEVEALVEAPVIASIPERRTFALDDPVLGEAYDILRANLAFLGLDHPLQVITMSSFNPREGKTSSVQGLGHAAARGALNTLLVDADLRTRTLSTRYDHGSSAGLSNLVAGIASVGDVVVQLDERLSLLPAGPTPPNPPSFLASGRVAELLGQLREYYDLIVIDCPPAAHLADASIVAAASDGIVVVARVGVTARADLTAAVANLRHSPTPIVGVVLLEPTRVDETYYPAVSGGARPPVPDTARS